MFAASLILYMPYATPLRAMLCYIFAADKRRHAPDFCCYVIAAMLFATMLLTCCCHIIADYATLRMLPDYYDMLIAGVC